MFITTDRLDDAVLANAVREEVLAVQVKQLIPRETAMKLGQRILGRGFDSYVNAPDIGRIGMALYEAENIPAHLDAYFDAALDNIDALGKRCMPYASPMDVLRCTLDEIWPAGAQLEHLDGRKAYVGLSQIIQPGSDKPRLSLSCSVGYRGVASPLTFWS